MPVKTRHIQSPYSPRIAFMPFHDRKERFACLVAHRRAGKTVAAVNDIIKRAVTSPPAPYHYFAPYRAQAKAVAWDYFKHYSHGLWQKPPNEAELTVFLVGERKISLFGADNADAARGQGSGGVYCDEYGDFRPSVWGNVIRPMLSERRGWAVFSGTPKGHNQFYDVHRVALQGHDESGDEYFSLVLKASQSGILHPDELRSARAQLSQDQYDQEYECSFDAAILGAFYGKEMQRVDAEGRIGIVQHDPQFAVCTAWDLGHYDDTAIWFYQNIGDQVRILDCYAESGGTIEDYSEDRFQPGSLVNEVIRRYEERGYRYDKHWLPHDARAKTLGSDGKSTVEKLAKYLKFETLQIAPQLSVQDGISATRSLLGRCWFDLKCGNDPVTGAPSSRCGIEAIRQYQREYNEDSHAFRTTPKHDWTSHYADALRMLAVSERRIIAEPKKAPPKVVDVRSMTLDELWEQNEERLASIVRV